MHTTDAVAYHLYEMGITQTPSDPRRIVPNYPCSGWKVLDVGCGIGQTLIAPELRDAAELHGIDVNADAIRHGKDAHRHLHLQHAQAENIPYPREYFDLTYSRVSLPYTDIPVALAEIRRVTKPGGFVWLTLHPWRLEAGHFWAAIKGGHIKRLVDRAYVCLNGLSLSLLGRTICRPWNGRCESVQTEAAIRRALRRAGFVNIVTERGDHHFLVRARTPG